MGLHLQMRGSRGVARGSGLPSKMIVGEAWPLSWPSYHVWNILDPVVMVGGWGTGIDGARPLCPGLRTMSGMYRA